MATMQAHGHLLSEQETAIIIPDWLLPLPSQELWISVGSFQGEQQQQQQRRRSKCPIQPSGPWMRTPRSMSLWRVRWSTHPPSLNFCLLSLSFFDFKAAEALLSSLGLDHRSDIYMGVPLLLLFLPFVWWVHASWSYTRWLMVD